MSFDFVNYLIALCGSKSRPRSSECKIHKYCINAYVILDTSALKQYYRKI